MVVVVIATRVLFTHILFSTLVENKTIVRAQAKSVPRTQHKQYPTTTVHTHFCDDVCTSSRPTTSV